MRISNLFEFGAVATLILLAGCLDGGKPPASLNGGGGLATAQAQMQTRQLLPDECKLNFRYDKAQLVGTPGFGRKNDMWTDVAAMGFVSYELQECSMNNTAYSVETYSFESSANASAFIQYAGDEERLRPTDSFKMAKGANSTYIMDTEFSDNKTNWFGRKYLIVKDERVFTVTGNNAAFYSRDGKFAGNDWLVGKIRSG